MKYVIKIYVNIFSVSVILKLFLAKWSYLYYDP